MSAPGVEATTSVRVGKDNPSTGTARSALSCARNPGVEAFCQVARRHRLLIQRLTGRAHGGINCVIH
ncbi:hypothetical protein [Citrobacter freundii]|uniref:Uncharacterized protein n=1 Tax=Citrobacter freundii TaxID=546 RepID=A0A7G2IQ53_CITFR|nr:hypothetical protein [Citrobacter freundii]